VAGNGLLSPRSTTSPTGCRLAGNSSAEGLSVSCDHIVSERLRDAAAGVGDGLSPHPVLGACSRLSGIRQDFVPRRGQGPRELLSQPGVSQSQATYRPSRRHRVANEFEIQGDRINVLSPSGHRFVGERCGPGRGWGPKPRGKSRFPIGWGLARVASAPTAVGRGNEC